MFFTDKSQKKYILLRLYDIFFCLFDFVAHYVALVG